MTIKERLRTYNTTIANILVLTNQLELLRLQYELYDVEAESLKTICYEEGMPVTFSNAFHSKTESVVEKREDLLVTIKKIELKLKELNENKVVVEANMSLLDNHERFIITKKYIDNLKYNWEIRESYKKEFQTYISNTTLIRKLNSALKKMCIS